MEEGPGGRIRAHARALAAGRVRRWTVVPLRQSDPTAPDTYNGPARPEILEFSAAGPFASPKTILPQWAGTPRFSEHSYRSFAADATRGELILFQNIDYTHAEWAFWGRDGRWSQGQLRWPWGAEYAKPQPIRVCYPNVALVDRAVYFCGVSDIVEPNPEWRAFKKQLTGKEWDYDFRRLFYVYSPDVTQGKWNEWQELASREKTCGWVAPGDLWVAPDGAVHLLWTERAIDERLRAKFFPDAKQSHSLRYAILKNGKVVHQRTLLESVEGGAGVIPGRTRLHAAPDGRLFALSYVSGRDTQGRTVSENRLIELTADPATATAFAVPLRQPFNDFFTATVRAGSPPSFVIDLLGTQNGTSGTISYARVAIKPGR